MTCSGFVPAVILGQNGPLSGPVGSRGPEVVAQNRNRALEPFEFCPKGLKEQKLMFSIQYNHFQEGLAQSKSGVTSLTF